MKKFFCRFVINLTQSYPHANANVIKEGGAVLYRKLVLVFAAAALTLPFMAGPAYSLTGSFVLPGHGSFSYDCQTSSPVGASYTFDTGANTFNAHVGALTCVFTLDRRFYNNGYSYMSNCNLRRVFPERPERGGMPGFVGQLDGLRLLEEPVAR
jgi:hypothetical protein